MINSTIASLILLLFVAPLFVNSKRAAKSAYQWWHIPYCAFLYVAAMYALFHLADVARWPGFNLLYDDYLVEAAYVLVSALIWQVARLFLRKESLHKQLIPWYRKVFGGRRGDRDRLLPFPYFTDHEGVLRARVGRPFYKRMLAGVIILVAVVYSVFYVLVEFLGIDFYLLSSFGLFGLLPLVDYYDYLKAEVPDEKEKETTTSGGGYQLPPSDMEKLWEQYRETFPDFRVAWKRKYHRDVETHKNNQDKIDFLMESFAGSDGGKGVDGFLEDCNLVDAFTQTAPLLDWAKESGRLVLMVMDMPNHFVKSHGRSYLQEMADQLKTLLGKENDLKVFDEFSADDDLNTSIVVASLSVLCSRDLDREWMKRIGLVVVVNCFDKSVANLYECRKFSFLLRAVNDQYQVLFITPNSKDIEPTLRNTWLTGVQTAERTMTHAPRGYHQFFIGYNQEDYLDRFRLILDTLPAEPLSAGSEMVPIALSYKLGDEEKVVTPVHLLDLAYSNMVEGIEELGRSCQKGRFPMREDDMNKLIHCHLLPLDKVSEPQVMAVVLDQNNNAPAAYSKWMHLGREENFTVVLSRPYLLRDYFNDNHDFFVNSPFLALQPQLSKSRVTLAVILLEMLQKRELSEQQLRGMLQEYYSQDEVHAVADVVQRLFATYFASDLAGRLKTRQTVVFDGSQYQRRTIYELDFKDSVSLTYLDRISVKDESDNVLFSIIKDLLCQNFDKGQTHSFLGKPYEITGFDSANRVLRVRAVNTKAQHVSFYKPVHSLTIGSRRHPIEDMSRHVRQTGVHPTTGQVVSLETEGFETHVVVGTSRWYEFCHYTADSPYFDATLLRERRYDNGRVLKVTLRFVQKAEYLQRKDDIRRGLQMLLYEVMQSVFPHHAQYLIISSPGEGDPQLPWIFPQFTCDDRDEPDALSFYFTEDAHIDLGLLGALSKDDVLGTSYLFRYIFDYLVWLTEGDGASASGYDEYLTRRDADKFEFLKYGRAQLPTYFDVDLLINFIRDFFCEGEPASPCSAIW